MLDLLRIATPCHEAWDTMTGDDKTRHCARCDKQVFDLSQRTRAEVEALLAERRSEMCARLFERIDGAIVLADCVVRRRKRVAAVVGVAAVLAAGVVHQLPHAVEAEPVPRVEIEETVDIAIPVVEVVDREQAIEDALGRLREGERTGDPHWRFSQIAGSFTGGVLASEGLAEALEAAFAPHDRDGDLLESTE